MGLRYRIPFKDFNNNNYVVEVHRADYQGEPTELRGASSCFVVSGTDEDFMYTPVRTSTATINVLDSEILLDLYSINNQYAPVKFYKNGVLEWTGYIKPEQFTQPYVPYTQNVSVECVCALATLENIEYVQFSSNGNITMFELVKTLIEKLKGSYLGVYIPNVYGKTALVDVDVLKDIVLIENNFISEGMNCLEVMGAVCKFLNWTLFDIGGYLYFIDSDWNGEYRLYNQELSSYSTVQSNSIFIQDIGYNGSSSNTLDIIHGYNKASVKALNHVFDDVVKDEDYDALSKYANGEYLVLTYSGDDGAHGVRKQFVKPKNWKVFAYNNIGEPLGEDSLASMNKYQLNNIRGAILVNEADYKCQSLTDTNPLDNITEFSYQEIIQMRISDSASENLSPIADRIGIVMEGEHAVYSECAISIDGEVIPYYDADMVQTFNMNIGERSLKIKAKIGDKYYNGSSWGDTETTFDVEMDEHGKIINTKTPFMPYRGINGYVIPIDFAIGQLTITIYIPSFISIQPDMSIKYCTGSKLRGLKFGYAKKEVIVEEGENGDRVYENVVNESYMSACDEIEFDISSYNSDGATYSKALLGESWLTNNLFCKVVEEYIRPEELLIRRIVNRYGETKIKLTEALRMTGDITPLTALYDRSMVNKRFRMTSGEWDYQQNRLTLQMQEDVE